MNNKNCAICGSQELRRINYKNTWSDLFKNKFILVCDKCGFGCIDPKIDANAILDFYKDVYRGKGSPHYVDFSKQKPSKAFNRARSISQLLLGAQYLEHKSKYNFLDIGSGLGKSFISANEILHGNVNLYTIEQDKNAKIYYQHYFKSLVILDDFSELDDDMDIILMSHSLEHFDIKDMRGLFLQVHQVLAENGIMIIEVPHADFRDKNYEDNRPKDVPHLSFFSLESLRMLVESFDFELCFIDTAGVLINDMLFSESIVKKKGFKSMLKEIFKKMGIYGCLAKLKSNIFLKSSSISKRDEFYKDENFQYKGDRAVLRCVLRKKI